VAVRQSQSHARISLATALAAVVLAICVGGAESAQAQGPSLRNLGSFSSPVHVAEAPQRPRLLYVVEQAGRIRVVRSGRKLGRPFLDIRGRVRTSGNEEGLLSVAFHSQFPRNRNFYVYYVNNAGNLQVDRFRSRPKPTRAKPPSRRRVIMIRHPGQSNHNGGQLQIGPHNLLYMATGDGGGGGDPRGNAQNRRSLLGKLLRIKPLKKGGHRSPKANPYFGRTGKNQIYSLGLRNPWRFSFDRLTDDLWIGDVGQSSREEINHASLADARGGNFGWNCREGEGPFGSPARVCSRRSGFIDPVHDYATSSGCAVTGGFVARGSGAPGPLRGRYVYGDHCNGQIRSLNPATGSGDSPTGLSVNALTSFGEGRNGRLYVASRTGGVHRIVD